MENPNAKWPQVDPKSVGPENKVRFAGLGYYLPPFRMTTEQVEQDMATEPLFSLKDLTGIEERRFARGTESSYDMALKAARNCLSNCNRNGGNIEAVIFVSIARVKAGYKIQFEPTIAAALKHALGAESAVCFDMSNACAGMATGVYVAEQMIRAGQVKNALVVSGEFISPIAETAMREVVRPLDRQMASLTVGDSAAAVLLEESPTRAEGVEYIKLLTVGEHAELCLATPSHSGMGVAMYTQSSKLQSEALKRLPSVLESASDAHGMFNACYNWLIPHQTSSRAIAKGLQVCAKNFGGRMEGGDERYFQPDSESVIKIVSKTGNTSTTSHFIAVCDGLHSGKIKPGDRVLMMIQASGLTLGSLSVTLGDLKVRESFEGTVAARLEKPGGEPVAGSSETQAVAGST